MKKVKVKTVGAVVDGYPIGSEIEINEDSATHLERIGYVKVIGEVEKPAKKKPEKKAATKKKTKK